MLEVKVPATSANVGPGFDCMGIALSAYASIRFETISEGLVIRGCVPKWQNEHNLVYRGICQVYHALHRSMPGFVIDIDAGMIPEARGLGSSAVCITAGAMAANAYCDFPFTKAQLVELCSALEGHPDNVAPAIYGGLTISFTENNSIYTARYDVSEKYRFCAMIPDYPILTQEARGVLPPSLSYQDAVYNIGRCAALAKGLSEGDNTLVAHACDDRLHQPYRKVLFPQYDAIDAICHTYGVLTWYISGSGSTMMAITDDDDIADALLCEVKKQYPAWHCRKLSADGTGAQVKEVSHG